MLSRIHDVPVDLRTNNEADPEDDNFHMVKNKNYSEKHEAREVNLYIVIIEQTKLPVMRP